MDKISKLYKFLEENKKHNQKIQNGFYRESTFQFYKPKDRIISLLNAKLNTQSQLNLDNSYKFWKHIYEAISGNSNCLDSLDDFIEVLSNNKKRKYKKFLANDKLELLFYILCDQPAWGEKTAALFVKSCCHIHWGVENEGLRFWTDSFPSKDESGRIFLPVDSVITYIFEQLEIKPAKFKTINDHLYKHYKSVDEMLLWDDLWYWGFISQNSKPKDGSKDRKLEWNLSKYYSIFYASKDANDIEQVKGLATEFIKLLEDKN